MPHPPVVCFHCLTSSLWPLAVTLGSTDLLPQGTLYPGNPVSAFCFFSLSTWLEMAHFRVLGCGLGEKSWG